MEAVVLKAVEDLGLVATTVRKDAKEGNEENTPPAGSQPGYLNKSGAAPSYQNSNSSSKPAATAAAGAAPAYQNASGSAPGYQSASGSAPAYQQAAGRPAGPGYLNGPPPARVGRKDSMVRYVGFGQTSLKARFAQKERERQLRAQKQEEAKSVFGRVSSFFW